MFKSRRAGLEESELNNGEEGGTVAFFCVIFFQPASLWHRCSERKVRVQIRVLEWGK